MLSEYPLIPILSFAASPGPPNLKGGGKKGGARKGGGKKGGAKGDAKKK